jgi:Ca2+-binding EF-hand superfamily protein
MKTTMLAWATTTVLALVTAAVSAQERGPDPDELFKRLDRDGDGKLASSEIGDRQKRFFERLVRVGDKDKNGELSKAEFLAALKGDNRPVRQNAGNRPQRRRFDPKATFARFDRNKDGKLSKEELPQPVRERFAPLFERLKKDEITEKEFVEAVRPQRQLNISAFLANIDKNKDGAISPDEVPERAKGLVRGLLKRVGKDAGATLTKEDIAKLSAEQNPRTNNRRPMDNQGRGPRILAILDTDRDGQLSKEELSKAAEKFNEFDGNKDGKLDVRELLGPPPGDRFPPAGGRPSTDRAAAENRMKANFARIDKNGDGSISKSEVPEEQWKLLKAADTDSNETVTFEEYKARAARRESRRQRDRDRLPEGMLVRMKQRFSQFDKNNDGKLEKSELPEELRPNFERADQNRDGSISLEEFTAGARRRAANSERPTQRRRHPETDEKKKP